MALELYLDNKNNISHKTKQRKQWCTKNNDIIDKFLSISFGKTALRGEGRSLPLSGPLFRRRVTVLGKYEMWDAERKITSKTYW